MLLHDGEDLDDDLGRRSDHDLSLSSSFGIDDVVLIVSIVQGVPKIPHIPSILHRDHQPPHVFPYFRAMHQNDYVLKQSQNPDLPKHH